MWHQGVHGAHHLEVARCVAESVAGAVEDDVQGGGLRLANVWQVNDADVIIVLHRPARAANIGAAARAMKVMGFTRLVLVSPLVPLDAEAAAVAHGAGDVLAQARIVDSLDEALQGATLVVGTTARHGKDRMTPIKLRRFVSDVLPTYSPAVLAVVFGCEESGLSNEDLERCQFAVEIPTGPLFHSLNLGQAVMVVCYELFTGASASATSRGNDAVPISRASDSRAADDVPAAGEPGLPAGAVRSTQARRQRMASFYRGLEQFLTDVGYPNRSSLTRAMADARRVLDATWLTERDVNTVLGLFRHIRFLLRQAGREVADTEDTIEG